MIDRDDVPAPGLKALKAGGKRKHGCPQCVYFGTECPERKDGRGSESIGKFCEGYSRDDFCDVIFVKIQ